MKNWIKAFRLRTLPLSLACVGMGSFLAVFIGDYSWYIIILSLLTTIFLQILSNLSNDYGDFVNGADHSERKGPSRTVQSGAISPQAMKIAIVVFVLLSLASGITLLLLSLEFSVKFMIFFLLGLMSIAAAIYYTMGSKPYGYSGLGDISVFLFFGWLGVCGTYYLHTGTIDYSILLPATSCSLFAVAVLNINNIRDIESDKIAGKKSIPVRIGRENAIFYHKSLLIIGVLCAIIFMTINYKSPVQFIFLLVSPLIIKNWIAISKYKEPHLLDPFLKQMALTTLVFVILFGTGLLLS